MVGQVILHTIHYLKQYRTITPFFFWKTNTDRGKREMGSNTKVHYNST